MSPRKLLILIGILCFKSSNQATAQQPNTKYSYTLDGTAKTSGGIYKSDGTLIRTLWNGITNNPGTYKIQWDGTDDEGNITPIDNYTAKVLANNVKVEWEGVVGNTSDSFTGETVHHNTNGIPSMVIVENTAYYAGEYNEGGYSEFKFNLSSPQSKIQILPGNERGTSATRKVCSDGVRIYWGGTDAWTSSVSFVFATLRNDDKQQIFSNGEGYQSSIGGYLQSVINKVTVVNSFVTGLAVQKEGKYLFVARKGLNTVSVVDKVTGLVERTLAVSNPTDLAIDANDNLLIISDSNVKKYSVNGDGTLGSVLMSLSGFQNPISVQVSFDNSYILVADGGGSQQLKAFSNISGASLWTFGQLGGYLNGPDVQPDKFCFKNTKQIGDPYWVERSFIAFQSDGSFWIEDQGTYRALHYSSARQYLECIQNLGYFYSCYVDQNNPSRVFANYLEFKVDYSLPLSPLNGSWKLVKNWAYPITSASFDQGACLYGVTTLSNGKTYAQNNVSNYTRGIVELPSNGNLRFTGIEFRSGEVLNPDGSIWKISGNELGTPAVWRKKNLIGFDQNNNPLWENDWSVVATSPNISARDPLTYGGGLRFSHKTSSDYIIAYSGESFLDGSRSTGYHLGAIKAGDNKWLWRTSKSTMLDYTGDFPNDGYFDIGNGVKYAGAWMQTSERLIIWGYRGEFWKSGQVNKWNLYYDNGLFIGQFGITRNEAKQIGQSVAGMAGNNISGTLVKVNNDYFLYHCDESDHGGIHRWKISGLNTIKEYSIPLSNSYERTSESPETIGINLMQGLPFDTVLVNNTNGWTRSPATEDYTNPSRYWSVKTNVKTYDKRKSPDLWIKYDHSSGPYSVSRDLGKNINLPSWAFSGKINFEDNIPNTDYASMYLDILDIDGKILSRFYTTIKFGTPSTIYIYANNTLIASGSDSEINPIISTFKPITISASEGLITIKYAGFKPVMLTPYDKTAKISSPQIMRLYFNHTAEGNSYNKVIDLTDLRLITTNETSYFRSNASGNWNNVNVWQSSKDSITWINTSTLPNAGDQSVTILNAHAIKITDSATVDQLHIQSGATLNVAPNASLIVNDGAGDDITIASSGNLIIQSDSTGSGRISNSTGTITGSVTVERYVGSANYKAYRLLSPSVNTANSIKPFIRTNWQENQNNVDFKNNLNLIPHYGIHINGSITGANGFDATNKGTPSLFAYDQTAATPDWVPVPNTNATPLEAKRGYLVFIRGDRSSSLTSNTTSSNTTLRATGTVLMGTQSYPNQLGNGGRSVIGNPYVSPINWKLIYNDASTDNAKNFENYYTYWEPKVGTQGGYVTVNVNGVKSAPTNGTTEIQSGQAFMIKAKKGIVSPTFTIKEDHKSPKSNINVFRTSSLEQFTTSLYYFDEGKRVLADAVTTVFNDRFSNNVDGDDAEEMSNWEENISTPRFGANLSIEARKLITSNDTLPLKMERLKEQQYEWQFEPADFNQSNLQAFLVDQFNSTRTPINLGTTTVIQFSVTSAPASNLTDRFKIIFGPQSVLPIINNSLKAYQKDEIIQLDWQIQNEKNTEKYDIEKSTDGLHYTAKGNVVSKNGNTSVSEYTWLDTRPVDGFNYYRIKIIDKTGAYIYSDVVSVKISNGAGTFDVYPNPLIGGYSTIHFSNIPKGKYTAKLINVKGQIISKKTILHTGGSASQNIPVDLKLPAGNYHMQITGNGLLFNKQLMK